MGTRSHIFVENGDGSYIGVYCHFDGYPEHMLEQIQFCSHEKMFEYVLMGGTKGGYRIFAPKDNGSEFLNDTLHYVYDPEFEDSGVDYIYIKCRDGSVNWRPHHGEDWATE